MIRSRFERTATLEARAAPRRRLLSGLAAFFCLVRAVSRHCGRPAPSYNDQQASRIERAKKGHWAGQGLQAPRELIGMTNLIGK
jgi:hypothetical protein